jgi:hypothetical protein
VNPPRRWRSRSRIVLNTTRPHPFVNTGLRLLNGFDVLYDADGGYYAFRTRRGLQAGGAD